jgi:hypothetical protein
MLSGTTASARPAHTSQRTWRGSQHYGEVAIRNIMECTPLRSDAPRTPSSAGGGAGRPGPRRWGRVSCVADTHWRFASLAGRFPIRTYLSLISELIQDYSRRPHQCGQDRCAVLFVEKIRRTEAPPSFPYQPEVQLIKFRGERVSIGKKRDDE